MERNKSFRSGVRSLLMGATFLVLFGMFACGNQDTGGVVSKKQFTVKYSVSEATKAKLEVTVGGKPIGKDGKVEEGKTVKFTVKILDSAYQVKEWSKNQGLNVSADKMSATVVVKKDLNVVVSLEKRIVKQKHKVKFSVDGANGKVVARVQDASQDIANGVAGEDVEEGKTVTFTATPDSNYVVNTWKDGTIDLTSQATNDKKTLVITVGNKDVDIKVSFVAKAKPKHKVKFSVDGANGKVVARVQDASQDIADGVAGEDVEEGKTVTFTATPDSNYVVNTWKDGTIDLTSQATNDKKTLVITVGNKDVDIKVNFVAQAKPKHKVKFSVDGANGSVVARVQDASQDIADGVAGEDVEEGKTVTFTATPDSNYVVNTWKDGTTDLTSEATNDKKTLVITVGNKDVDIKVSFVAQAKPKHKVKFSVDGANGSVVARVQDASQDIADGVAGEDVEEGKTVTFTATPNMGYVVNKWMNGSNDLTSTATEENKKLVITVGTEDVNITVSFKSAPLTAVNHGEVTGKLEKGSEAEDGKRTPTFDVTYPEFDLSAHTGKYIGFYLELENGAKFADGTTIKLTYKLTPKSGVAESDVVGAVYTVSGSDTARLLDCDIFGNSFNRVLLEAKHSGATENFKFEITLPSGSTTDLNVKIVKAIFNATTGEDGKQDLQGDVKFTLKGYNQ